MNGYMSTKKKNRKKMNKALDILIFINLFFETLLKKLIIYNLSILMNFNYF